MRDNVRLALFSRSSMTGDEISDYIRDNIDSEAKIITIYLTVRTMHKEGLLVRLGERYQMKRNSSKLLEPSIIVQNEEEPEKVTKKKIKK